MTNTSIDKRIVHGMTKRNGPNHRIYNILSSIKQRCLNPNNKNYRFYGGRGITICDEWMNVQNFYNWAIKNGYNENLSIDREDNNGNYEPSNCRWVDATTQNNNRRNCVFYVYKQERLSVAQLARKYGLKNDTLHRRLERGWSIEVAIETPLMNGQKSKQVIQLCSKGENKIEEYSSANEASIKTGLKPNGIRAAANGSKKSSGGFKWKYKTR